MVLDKYTSSSVSKHITLEGTSLVQRASNKHLPPYDKYWKICNASYAYRKVTQHHIKKKQLQIQRVKNKLMKENITRVNQVSPPRLARQQV